MSSRTAQAPRPAPATERGPGAAGPHEHHVGWVSLRAWFGRRSLLTRVVVVVVGCAVAANLVLTVVASLLGGSQPGGPTGSSYATGSTGLAAWAELLSRNGHGVVRLRGELAKASVPDGSTVVVATEGLQPDEVSFLRSVLARGGRVVLIGAQPTPLVGGTGIRLEDLRTGDGDVRPLSQSAEVAGIGRIDAGRGVRVDTPGPLSPILGEDRDHVLAAAGPAGGGRVVALTDAGPLTNDRLAKADNAAFALQVVGGRSATVSFAEGVHGYGGSATGISAFPVPLQRALYGLLGAVLVGLWAAGKRFGPVEDAERALAPARRGYVDAVGVGMAQGRRPAEAVAPVRTRVRRLLLRRTGLGSDTDDLTLSRAAAATGLAPEVVRSALTVPADEQQLVDVCAAASRLLESRGGSAHPDSPIAARVVRTTPGSPENTNPDPGGHP